MPSKDTRVKSRAWRFSTTIPAGISENLGDLVLGLLRGRREQHELISLPGLHTVSFSVPAHHAASSDANVVRGFFHGPKLIAESAVKEWLPGPEDTTGIKFEWEPIRGSLKKDAFVINYFSEIASGLTTRICYVDSAPNTKNGRPRSIDHGTSLDSFESGGSSNPSMNPVESSLQSSLSIESSSTSNFDAASAHDFQSSLGSATSARDLHERRILMAELQAARQAAAAEQQAARQAAARAEIALKELQMEREKAHREREKAQREREQAQREREQAQREREQWERDREKEREEARTELKEVKASLRRLTRKQKDSKAVTLRHGDGTTTKLHNVSSVFR